MPRFTSEHVETWRRDGCVLLERFFNPTEVAAVRADFEAVFSGFAPAAEPLDLKSAGEIGRFHPAQFRGFEAIPFD